jgi:hypothetical protein
MAGDGRAKSMLGGGTLKCAGADSSSLSQTWKRFRHMKFFQSFINS